MSTAKLVDGLRAIGFDAQPEPAISGFAIKQYPIGAGSHAGDKVDIAVTIDFPLTPPVGIHVRASYGKLGVNDGKNNVQASPLGEGWRYFSRRYERWNAHCDARSVIAYINTVLFDA